MGGNALLFHQLKHEVAHLVVDDALARDGALFQPVKRRGVVLIIDDNQVGIVRREYLFCLSFVQLFFLFHFFIS